MQQMDLMERVSMYQTSDSFDIILPDAACIVCIFPGNIRKNYYRTE